MSERIHTPDDVEPGMVLERRMAGIPVRTEVLQVGPSRRGGGRFVLSARIQTAIRGPHWVRLSSLIGSEVLA